MNSSLTSNFIKMEEEAGNEIGFTTEQQRLGEFLKSIWGNKYETLGMGLVLNLDKEKFFEWCKETIFPADLCYKYLLEDHVNFIENKDSELKEKHEKDKLLDNPKNSTRGGDDALEGSSENSSNEPLLKQDIASWKGITDTDIQEKMIQEKFYKVAQIFGQYVHLNQDENEFSKWFFGITGNDDDKKNVEICLSNLEKLFLKYIRPEKFNIPKNERSIVHNKAIEQNFRLNINNKSLVIYYQNVRYIASDKKIKEIKCDNILGEYKVLILTETNFQTTTNDDFLKDILKDKNFLSARHDRPYRIGSTTGNSNEISLSDSFQSTGGDENSFNDSSQSTGGDESSLNDPSQTGGINTPKKDPSQSIGGGVLMAIKGSRAKLEQETGSYTATEDEDEDFPGVELDCQDIFPRQGKPKDIVNQDIGHSVQILAGIVNISTMAEGEGQSSSSTAANTTKTEVIIIGIYIRSNSKNEVYEKLFESLSKDKQLKGKTLIIIGDFNIKDYFDSISTSKNSKKNSKMDILNKFCEDLKLKIINNNILNNNGRILDLVLVPEDFNYEIEVFEVPDLFSLWKTDSHHPPMIITVDSKDGFSNASHSDSNEELIDDFAKS